MTKSKKAPATHIRVQPSTYHLLDGMKNADRRTIDSVIKWMWGKLSNQAAEINQWKKVTGCKKPAEFSMETYRDAFNSAFKKR